MKSLLKVVLLMLALASGATRAETPLSLFKTISGKVNFVGGEWTLLQSQNGNSCKVYSSSQQLGISITGIPTTATIVSAQVYIAGSSATQQSSFIMDGVTVTAPAARRYSMSFGGGLDYFAFGADVTSAVAAKRNGLYAFSGISIDKSNPWCSDGTVLGGYSLVVIYSDSSEVYRVLNLYEGMQSLQNSSVVTTMNNFRIPATLSAANTARVAYFVWEGDSDITSTTSEFYKLNSTKLTDAANPNGNPFNSYSNIDGDPNSYAVDVDAYTVASPAFSAGQTSATTTISTGGDFLALTAQIIAMPNAASDMAIALSLNSSLVVGTAATYTITVSNNGPDTETVSVTPTTVTTTLPANLTYSSATGSGWTCGASGQTVTCTTTTAAASGASLPAITLTVNPNATGSASVTSTVVANNYDDTQANNTATNTSTVSAAGGPAPSGYAYTDSLCVDGYAFGSASQPCKEVTWSAIRAGTVKTDVYVTAVSSSNVPTQFSSSAVTSKSMQFAIRCVNPSSPAPTPTLATVSSTVGAAVTSVTLPACASNVVPATWSTAIAMSFGIGQPTASGKLSFAYADVGQIQLHVGIASSSVLASSAFIQIPAAIKLSPVTGNTDSDVESGAVFKVSGAVFSLSIGAYTTGNTLAPNFGREDTPEVMMLDAPASGSTNTTHVDATDFTGSFNATSGGLATGNNFSWKDTGIVLVTPKLASGTSYLGASTAAASTDMTPMRLGRFVPAYFDTSSTGPIVCPARLNCTSPLKAAYSKQPFSVTVTAHRSDTATATNYKGDLARQITLSQFSDAGGSTPVPGVLSANTFPATAFAIGVGTTATPVFTFLTAFDYSKSQERSDWVAPTKVYLRAVDEDAVTSLRTGGTASAEGPVYILSGRLYVANIHGSELLPVPIKMTAQYWSGTSWDPSSTDSTSSILPADTVYTCSNSLGSGRLSDCTVDPIKTKLKLQPTTATTLASGTYTFYLNALGRGYDGRVDLRMSAPTWLPSTVGTIRIGVARSPLLYLREVY